MSGGGWGGDVGNDGIVELGRGKGAVSSCLYWRRGLMHKAIAVYFCIRPNARGTT